MPSPCHPGQILCHFLEGRAPAEVAAHLGVPLAELSAILDGTAGISADMALRLAEAFITKPDLWLRLQMQYDLSVVSKQKRAKVKPFDISVAA
jgi:addiction module HigA family antidote